MSAAQGTGRVAWPGEEVPCPAGCTQYPPLQAPDRRSRHKSGCWGALCRSCGRTLFLRPHYGDREEDLCWVTQETVPAGLEDLAHAMADQWERRAALWASLALAPECVALVEDVKARWEATSPRERDGREDEH